MHTEDFYDRRRWVAWIWGKYEARGRHPLRTPYLFTRRQLHIEYESFQAGPELLIPEPELLKPFRRSPSGRSPSGRPVVMLVLGYAAGAFPFWDSPFDLMTADTSYLPGHRALAFGLRR